ncbi:MAG: hypothetical protein OEY59_00970, partial [Deltaproteobacteria bacterium]|nr:hypothetical protein [Deltaproteobacteria bacterium]
MLKIIQNSLESVNADSEDPSFPASNLFGHYKAQRFLSSKRNARLELKVNGYDPLYSQKAALYLGGTNSERIRIEILDLQGNVLELGWQYSGQKKFIEYPIMYLNQEITEGTIVLGDKGSLDFDDNGELSL